MSIATESTAPPLLTQADLDDPDQFVTIPGVPVLDVHQDPDPKKKRGDIDLDTLRKIHRNTAERAARGDFPMLTFGHYIARSNPHGATITHPDGSSLRIDHDTEEHLPKPAGFGSRWRIGLFRGRPTLHCDYHIHQHVYDEAREYPFRSVERMRGPEFVDRVALLRRPPERDLGAIRYAKEEQPGERILYARDFPPLDLAERTGDLAPSSPDQDESSVLPEPTPSLPPAEEKESHMATAAMEEVDFSPRQLETLRNLFRELLHEEMAGPDEEVPPDVPAEPVAAAVDAGEAAGAAARDNHAAGTGEAGAGGMGTSLPELEDEPTRENYARNLALIDQAFDATDQRLTRNDRELIGMANRIMVVEKQLADSRVENRRLVYRKDLLDTRADGYHTLTDATIAGLLAEITADTPAGYEPNRLKDIRTNYARSPVGASQRIPAGMLEVGGSANGNGNGQPTVAEVRMARAYANDNKCNFTEGLAKIRAK